jgi:hypothetical protein
MAVSRITREDMVEQSVTDFLRNALFVERQYPAAQVQLLEAFEPSRFEPMTTLDKNYVSIGFNFDDGGSQAELGSSFRRRIYTIEVWVVALTPVAGRNLANAVRDALDASGLVPLKDLTQSGTPVIDQLLVQRVRADRQPIADPRPWQENVWVVAVEILDEYYAAGPAD